jgi:large subunit ribosomal protein L25
MAQESQEITVERREVLGRKGRSLLKKVGHIPAVVYGGGKDPVPISVDPKQIINILRSSKGANSVFLFALKGTDSKRHVMIKDFQIEPITNALMHADFRRISLDERVKVNVPVKYEGIPIGVKNSAGIVDIILRDVEVECLPEDIPINIPVDMSDLDVNDAIRISDLTVEEKVTIVAEDKTLPLVHVLPPRVEIEEEEEEPEEEVEEGAEPEVIGKGKKEDGEEEKSEKKGEKKGEKKEE